MIFLAVTLGFFADNVREHFADSDKEKRNIESNVASPGFIFPRPLNPSSVLRSSG